MQTNDEIKENIRKGIEKMKKYKEENKHPHCMVCNNLDEAFNLKLIQYIDGVVWIIGKYHKIEIQFCPFCQEGLVIGFDFDSMILESEIAIE